MSKLDFTHLNGDGTVSMVGTADKLPTRRAATASCFLRMAPATVEALRKRALPKGDALALAQVAGIQAVKWTAHLIPLCHSLEARRINVDLAVEEEGVRVRATVETVAPTGPEMEALVGASLAGLALYDMCKAVDKGMVLEEVHLESKSGGKSSFNRDELVGHMAVILTLSDRLSDQASAELRARGDATGGPPSNRRANARGWTGVRSGRPPSEQTGVYKDESGPLAESLLEGAGLKVLHREIIPDERELLTKRLSSVIEQFQPDLVLTLGSTGLSPRDIAPEATLPLIERSVPGLPEALRTQFFPHHPTASFLSRGVAGLRGKTLIVNLPGRPSAIREGLGILIPSLGHVFKMLEGDGHEKAT